MSTIRIKGCKFQFDKFVANDYTWGTGGITKLTQSTGSVNDTISTISAPYAENDVTLKVTNGYAIYMVVTDTSRTKSSDWHIDTYPIELQQKQVTVPAGHYFAVAIFKIDRSTASVEDGNQSLLVRV